MKNRKLPPQVAKRLRVKPLPRKKAQIFDDSWLEALKHLTCSQWSLMRLISRQVNGVIQRNLSRLPPPVIKSATLQWYNFWFYPRTEQILHAESSMARSVRLLFHPSVYFKEVTINADHRKLMSDVNSNIEDRYIRCHSFNLMTSGDIPGKRSNVMAIRTNTTALSESLKWLEQNVRSVSISFPDWVSYRVHETVGARVLLSKFIFGASQKCKVEELVFTRCDNQVEFLNNLIEDFLALRVLRGTIPTVVIDRYPSEEEYRAHLGENLIGQVKDSQGAHALYEIENGDKRVRISFCHGYSGYTANVKFYTI